MGKASLTIAISGEYNSRAVERARRSLRDLETTAAAVGGGISGWLVKAGAKAAELGGSIYSAGKKMESIGSAATRSITLPIAGAAAACGAAAVDIDTALTGVRKTVDGTEAQYQSLKQAAVEFSKTNAVSASQILDIQALGAQLGFAIDELDEFSRVVSGLDIATNMDAEQAGTELAQFANITKMAHSEVSNYASAIVGLGNTSATTESNISSMAMRIAAAGTQVGMSQADILGLSAALASMGIEAEAGGTAISTVMANIDKAVATNSDKLAAWAEAANMSTEQFAVAWKERPVEALAAVLSGMEAATSEGGNMSLMLDELGISSIRQTDVLKRLAGNSDLVTKSVATANEEWGKNTALQAEVDNRNESMAARFDMLKNKVVAAAESVGTPLVDALLDVVDAAEPLIEGIGAAAQAFADMDQDSQRTILGLVGAAAAFGPVVSIAGKVAKVVGSVSVAFGKGLQATARFGNGLKSAGKQVDASAKSAEVASAETKALGASAETASAQLGTMSKQTEKSTKSVGKLKEATGLLGGALKVAGKAFVGIFTAEAVSMAIGLLFEMREHAEMVEGATTGLREATNLARASYDGFSSSLDDAAASMSGVSISADEALQSQADLAKSMKDAWNEVGTNSAMVDRYVSTIKDLADKSNLSAREQAQLQTAVEGFNSLTGSQVEIIDAANGKLSENADNILKIAEAYKEEARQKAAASVYQDLVDQELRNTQARREAIDQLREAQQKMVEAQQNGDWLGYARYKAEAEDLNIDINNLTNSINANRDSQSEMLAIMEGAGQSFATLNEALETTGTKLSDFEGLSEAELATLESEFDGTLSSIVSSCETHGYAIPESLASGMQSGKGSAASAAEDVALSSAGAVESTLDNKRPQIVTKSVRIGEGIDDGIKEGMEGRSWVLDNPIISLGRSIMEKFCGLLGIHSPSTVFAGYGSNIVEGVSEGVTSATPQATTSIGQLGQGIIGAIANLPSLLLGVGQQSGSGLASGIGSGTGGASAAASSLSQSAWNGVSGLTSAFGSVASQAVSWFKNAISSSSAYGSAQNLAVSARNGLGSVDSSGTGRNFVQGFANGFNGVNIFQAAYNVGVGALSAIKRALGIHSPSREAMEVGEMFGMGAVIGMKGTEAAIASEAGRMSEAMELRPKGYDMAGPAGRNVSYAPYAASKHPSSYVFNVTVNVYGATKEKAVEFGQTLGESLYEEMRRRERAIA